MASKAKKAKGKRQSASSSTRRSPWPIALLVFMLAGSIYFFWILPSRLGPRPVEVDFVNR
jgi:hypothetical protein